MTGAQSVYLRLGVSDERSIVCLRLGVNDGRSIICLLLSVNDGRSIVCLCLGVNDGKSNACLRLGVNDRPKSSFCAGGVDEGEKTRRGRSASASRHFILGISASRPYRHIQTPRPIVNDWLVSSQLSLYGAYATRRQLRVTLDLAASIEPAQLGVN